jgi:hypothetical protein
MTPAIRRLWRWLKSPSRVYPLVLLFVYIWLGLAYFSRYVPEHRRNLDDQAFRILQASADLIGSNIEDLTSIVQTQVQRRAIPDPKVQQLPVDLEFARQCDPQAVSNVRQSILTLRPWPDAGKIILRWVYRFSDAERNGRTAPGGHPLVDLCAQTAFENNVAPVVQSLLGGPFEQVALALDDGQIVFSQGKVGVGIADFNRFLAEQKPTLSDLATQRVREQKAASSSDKDPMTRLSSMIELAVSSWSKDSRAATSSLDWDVRGRHYLLLMQPVAATVSTLSAQGQLNPQLRLTLIGIVDSQQMDRQANYLSVGIWANLLIIFVCILIFSGTLLKFFSAGAGEAIRNHDLGLFFCGMCCISALGSMLFFLDVNRKDYRDVDLRMKQLAETIQSNFSNEIRSVLDLFEILPQTQAFADDTKAVRNEQARGDDNRLVFRTQALTGKSQCKLLDLGQPDESPGCGGSSSSARQLSRVLFRYYPWLDQIFWTAPSGWQALKWTVKSQITGRVKASNYDWYRKLSRGQTWSLTDHGSNPTRREFAFDTLYSPNTAEYLATILMVSRGHPNGAPPLSGRQTPEKFGHERAIVRLKMPVVAAVTPMISLAKPIVPSGYGFALIDSDGLVRFHSDPSRNLRENFLSELGSRRKLTLSSASVQPFEFEDSYHGAFTRFRVQQLSIFGSTAYTLVVYRDLDDRDSLYQRALLISLCIGLIYGLMMLGAIRLSVWFGEKLWTHIRETGIIADLDEAQARARRRRNFASSILNVRSARSFVILLLVVIIVGTIVVIRLFSVSPDSWDVPSLALILLCALSLFPLLAVFGEPADDGCMLVESKGSWRPKRWQFVIAFTLAAISIAYLFGCVPAFLITKSAFRISNIPYRIRALSQLASQLESRADLTRSYYARVPNAEYLTDPSLVSVSALTGSVPFLYERLRRSDDLYLQHWVSYSDSSDESGCNSSRLTTMSWMLPDWPLGRWDSVDSTDALVPASFHACRSGNQLLLFLHPPHGSADNYSKPWRTPVRLQMDLPVMPTGNLRVLLFSTIIPIFCGVIFSVVIFRVLKILPKKRPPSSTTRLKTLDLDTIVKPGQSRKNWFFRVPPRFQISDVQWSSHPGVEIFSLDKNVANLTKFQASMATRVLVIASFETGLGRHRSGQTLDFVNKLLAVPECKLVIMSSVEPITYLFDSLLLNNTHPVEQDLKRCEGWVNAMIAFEGRLTEELKESVDKGDTGDTYFLWSHCTNRQKLALWQMVQFGMANRVNQIAIDQLAAGFLVTYNEDTGRMIVARPLDNLILRSESIRKEVRLLLESRVDTLWQGFKGSLFVTAIAGAVFFAVTWTALSFWSELFVTVASLGGAVAAMRTVGQLAASIPSRGPGRTA